MPIAPETCCARRAAGLSGSAGLTELSKLSNLAGVQRWMQAVITHPDGVAEGVASDPTRRPGSTGGAARERRARHTAAARRGASAAVQPRLPLAPARLPARVAPRPARAARRRAVRGLRARLRAGAPPAATRWGSSVPASWSTSNGRGRPAKSGRCWCASSCAWSGRSPRSTTGRASRAGASSQPRSCPPSRRRGSCGRAWSRSAACGWRAHASPSAPTCEPFAAADTRRCHTPGRAPWHSAAASRVDGHRPRRRPVRSAGGARGRGHFGELRELVAGSTVGELKALGDPGRRGRARRAHGRKRRRRGRRVADLGVAA